MFHDLKTVFTRRFADLKILSKLFVNNIAEKCFPSPDVLGSKHETSSPIFQQFLVAFSYLFARLVLSGLIVA